MPKVTCKLCKELFHAKPSHLKLGYGKFCSQKCSNEGKKKGKYVLCEHCCSKTWKTPRDFKRSKSKKYFCSKSCQTKWRNTYYSGSRHPNWQGGEFTYHKVMKEAGTKPLCKHCGIKNKKVLVIHHIDHNRKNNTIDNLMWLCRNCHYLIHNGKTI